WNLGPTAGDATVGSVVAHLAAAWEAHGLPVPGVVERPARTGVEAPVLRLDATRAARELGWTPPLDDATTSAWTAEWYAAWHRLGPSFDARAATLDQIGRCAWSAEAPAPVAS